jgi:hypothetical protein
MATPARQPRDDVPHSAPHDVARCFYAPLARAEEWQRFLAKPDLHWKTGYSARSLAYSWTEAQGFPEEVASLFHASGEPALQDLMFLLGIPEHEVALPGGRRASQNDVFVLARGSEGLVCIVVEGKVAESFDLPVDQRFATPSPGQQERLRFLLDLLELERDAVGSIGYQLLHRAASGILEAQRFGARHAVMLVHSFSQELAHFADYAAFARLYGCSPEPLKIVRAGELGGVNLHLGWVVGDPEYLRR